MRFEDPMVRCTDRSQYLLNVRALRTAFNIDFTVHEVDVKPPAEIVVRCVASALCCVVAGCASYRDVTSRSLDPSSGCARRWAMAMRSRFLPWRPTLNITGVAHYSVDCSGVTGQIMSHRDEWDALVNNSFPSVSYSVVFM